MNFDFISDINRQRIDQLANTKGSNDKIDIARSLLEYKDFRELVQYAYDPFKQFKIKKIISKHYAMRVQPPDSIKEFLDYMSKKESANDEDVAKAGAVINCLDHPDMAFLFQRVLKKDLKVGMNVTGWNKAGYCIPKFGVQLACSQSHLDKFLDENKDGFIVQTKYDGHRAILIIDNASNYKFLSRNGHPIESCEFLLNQLKLIGLPPNSRFDGEIIHKSLNLQKLQSIISRKDSNHEFGKELTYQIFDVMELDGNNLMDSSQEDRIHNIHKISWNNDYILPAPFKMYKNVTGENYGMNPGEFIEMSFQESLQAGHEGLMLKSLKSNYETRRSRNWVKVKERDTIDVEVLEISEGKSGDRFSGMLGAAIAEYRGKRFNIGSGWSDKERELYFDNPNELIGKTLEVSYWKLSPNGVPLHSSKVRIRSDK
jgi:DNA ligase 1